VAGLLAGRTPAPAGPGRILITRANRPSRCVSRQRFLTPRHSLLHDDHRATRRGAGHRAAGRPPDPADTRRRRWARGVSVTRARDAHRLGGARTIGSRVVARYESRHHLYEKAVAEPVGAGWVGPIGALTVLQCELVGLSRCPRCGMDGHAVADKHGPWTDQCS
jgi:hypothetical protein